MILYDQREEEVVDVDVEEEDTVVDSAEEGEAEEEDQAVAPLQEFVPFLVLKVAICC